jgi:hypothetical protein
VPPVRPGTVYYVGIRAKNDATFSIASATTGGSAPQPPVIAFYGGSVNLTIPANSEVVYRILTPGDGLRWRHTSTHTTGIQVFVENGTLPVKGSTDDFRSTVANSTLDRFLTGFPWLPNQTYFLVATNTTATAQPFMFNMNGSSVTADDDNDGMLDVWELQYFGAISQSGTADYDNDGVINAHEFAEGTLPNDPTSLRPRLTVVALNGDVAVTPNATNYTVGTVLSLTPTPHAGFHFLDWNGGATGSASPLVITLTTNVTITPRFRVPGDDFDQRVPLSGYAVSQTVLTTVGATKQSGEPNHGGISGGSSVWWTWTAPGSGTVAVTSAGSDYRNALGVYTGSAVNNLTTVAGSLAGGGATSTQVEFEAVVGTTYHFAMDGYSAASGSATLSFSISGSPSVLGVRVRGGDGRFRFTIASEPGLELDLESTEDFDTWTPVGSVTNTSGTIEFTDPTPAGLPRRFYRGNVP